MRLLVVEDHLDTATLLHRLLSMDGHAIDIAGDISSALELCERNNYDVLLADIELPDGSGWELMKTLLKRRPVRAIAISGHGYNTDVQKSIQAGFAEHLTKPITIENLYAAIERVGSLPLGEGPGSTLGEGNIPEF